jgi:hypothetical protein
VQHHQFHHRSTFILKALVYPKPPSSAVNTRGFPCADFESDNRRPWLPKMEFPWFDGFDVRVWLDKCSAYFHLYGIPPDYRVTGASYI